MKQPPDDTVTDDKPSPKTAPRRSDRIYSEFLSYASKRRGKGGPRSNRPVASPSIRPPSWTWDHRQVLVGGAAVVFFLAVILLIQSMGAGPHASPPEWVQLHKQRLSSWMNLPRPDPLGTVPDTWGKLRLRMKRDEIESTHLVKYDAPGQWADVAYVPDPGRPEAFFALSFHRDRLYRISIRLGEESMVATAPYVASGTVAYGQARGYDYLTAGASHVVTIFQTGPKTLKLDSIRRGEELFLCEVTLIDLDLGTQRELERARGTP